MRRISKSSIPRNESKLNPQLDPERLLTHRNISTKPWDSQRPRIRDRVQILQILRLQRDNFQL